MYKTLFDGISDEKLKEITKDIYKSKVDGKRVESLVPYAQDLYNDFNLNMDNPTVTLRECLYICREDFLLELCKRINK